MDWHVLDAGSIWIKEFASALGRTVPTLGWVPEMKSFAIGSPALRTETLSDPSLQLIRFPLQRGYYRFPMSRVARFGRRECNMIAQASDDPASSPLICTTPFYAPVAESWKGPVAYYLTDFTFGYGGVDPQTVRALDIRMCRRADLVYPNSRRIGAYLVAEAGCDGSKVRVVPNATRSENILREAMFTPSELPSDVADLKRPIAGVIGNLAGNMDWCLLEAAIRRTPWLTWLFVGPTDMAIADDHQRQSRANVLSIGGRVHFTGAKPYGQLKNYARAFDVAVLPYVKQEPTFSGSATRFYEHLAACRPILSTRGVDELLDKEPLLRLADSSEELIEELEALRRSEFSDGFEAVRWKMSHNETWSSRAAVIRAGIEQMQEFSDAPLFAGLAE